MAKKIKCPKWGCNGIGQPLTDDKKFSVVKGGVGAAAGAALLGPIGLVGAGLGLNGHRKVTFVCPKCGRTWKQKI